MSETPITLPEKAVRELTTGSKIGAIKIVRESNNLGLKEAKELVELYLDENPSVQAKLSSVSQESGKAFLVKLVVLGLILALVYFGYQTFVLDGS